MLKVWLKKYLWLGNNDVFNDVSVKEIHISYGRGKTPNAERRMQNAQRRMHCLLAVNFTCGCLRLAFICWKGQHFIVFGPFQQIKANRKQTQVKLTASKQCIRRSAFCVLPLPYILLDVLVCTCSIAVYFYQLCRILASP